MAHYEGATARLVRAFKYGGRDQLAELAGRALSEAIVVSAWSGSADALVVVPTHWRHALGRRFYAPALVCGVVSRVTGIPRGQVLRRVAAGPHQFDVPRAQRAANIRGKFALVRGASVAGARLCVIDDVSTTGATLNECARVLKQAGAQAVYGAVVAKVDTEWQVRGSN